MKKKSILIKEFHHREMVKISRTFGVPYGDLVQSMIMYFKKTGINPVEAINENPAALIKILDKRMVAFLRVQERDILKPMRTEMYNYSQETKRNIDDYRKKINQGFNKMDEYDQRRTDLVKSEVIKVLKKQRFNAIEKKLIQLQKAFFLMVNVIDQKNKSGLKEAITSIFK